MKPTSNAVSLESVAVTIVQGRPWIAFLAVVAFAAIILCSQLNDRDLWPSHEARAAQNAAGFLETGHWGLLRLYDGTPEYQKPPLFYWLIASVAWLRGGAVDAWSVRLPAAIAGLVTIAVVMRWLSQRGRPLAAIIAGLALLCANHFVSTSRTGRIDAPLMCTVTVAILAAIERRWIIASVALAAAVLLKGPIGVALFVTITVLSRTSRFGLPNDTGVTRPTGRAIAGITLLALMLAAPWFIAVSVETGGEYTRSFFLHHNFARAAGTASDLAAHPWWTYLARWLVDWLPATPALLIAIWLAAKYQWWRQDYELRLGLIWFIGMTCLLSLSRFKRADYLLPAYPGAAILIGCAFERVHQHGRYGNWVIAGGAATILVAIVGANVFQFTILPAIDAEREKRTLAYEIRAVQPAGQPVIFFRVEDHLLAFHLGKPIHSINEWENLNIWVSRLNPGCIVMPVDEAAVWSQSVHTGTLREITRTMHKSAARSLAVMQSHPQPATTAP